MDMKHIILFVLLPLLLREKDGISKANETSNGRDLLTQYAPLRELGVVDPDIGRKILRDEEMLLQNDSLLQKAKSTTILPTTTNETTVYYERNERRNGVNNGTNGRVNNRQKGGGDDKNPHCRKGKIVQLHSTTANRLYISTCPGIDGINMTEPCPRGSWKTYNKKPTLVEKDDQGRPYMYHYWYLDLQENTLFDYDPIFQNVEYDRGQRGEDGSGRKRIHTCATAPPVTNLEAKTNGLGWIYFVWRRPAENCWGSSIYKWEYNIKNETSSQDDVGIHKVNGSQYQFKKFHPCPEYPNWFCFVISENVLPYTNLTFKVAYVRFGRDRKSTIDSSPWLNISFATDDENPMILFCPPVFIWNKLWFLIFLIILFLLLVIIACVLIALLHKRKRKAEREEDQGYEEEYIPPSNIFEKIWERLRNFFGQLCPRPKKPPPPPPPPPSPPPKRKSSKKPKPPPKQKSKMKPPPPKPKPKPKTPSPPSPEPIPPPPPPPPIPPPSPPPKKEETPPPPPPPPPKKAKKRMLRDGRKERPPTKGQVMDSKRAASGVGGAGGRKRRRP